MGARSWRPLRISGSGRRGRTVEAVLPRTGTADGLAYALWCPTTPPVAGVLIVHGAGSAKESHYDFARAAIALGFVALTFDQRGHGESEGRLDGRAVEDVVAMAAVLRRELPDGETSVALRGSSLGGYLCLRAADEARAQAVLAISPASPNGLRRALENESLPWRIDRAALVGLLEEVKLPAVVSRLDIPVLFMHAQGDEQVPVELSRELAADAQAAGSRLIEVPGGHHRSVQHDAELQAVSLRFLQGAFGLRRA
ncbi:MAG: alpha/beta fold hydrolase [Solirubrobacteraceae bacterium]